MEKLLADIEIPVPDEVVLDEVNAHLEGEGRLEDDAFAEQTAVDLIT